MKQKITISLFATLLFGLSLINILSPAKTFSENENRYLTKFPSFSRHTLVSGEFTEQFEEYASDQFLYRDYWIGLKTFSEMILLKNESSGVYFTKNNSLIETFQPPIHKQFERNLEYLHLFAENVDSNYGIPVYTMLIPTAAWIQQNQLPTYAPEINQDKMLQQAANYLDGLINTAPILSEHHEEYIYYRTDHHYTSLGAFYCYQEYLAKKGDTIPALTEYRQTLLSNHFLGTVHSKAGLYLGEPDEIYSFYPLAAGSVQVDYNFGEKITDTIYETSYLESKDQYSVFLNANQPFVKIQTEQNNGERLLLIKDSYANTFVQFLLDDFEEIYMIDLRYYKASSFALIEELNISEVLILYNLKGFSEDTNLFFITQ